MNKNFTFKITTLFLILLSGVAKADVVYTDNGDITTTVPGPGGQTLTVPVDLNNDAVFDFYITVSNQPQSIDMYSFTGQSIAIASPNGSSTNFVLTDGTIYKAVRPNNPNVSVEAASTTWDGVGGVIAANGTVNDVIPTTLSGFANQGDKYIAVKFGIGSFTHYGWIRVSVSNYNTIVIKDYAYDNEADQSILTGQTTTAISKYLDRITTVRNVNNVLEVEFLNHFEGNIDIVTSTGQIVKSIFVSGKSLSIPVSSFTTGIYQVVVSGKEGYAAKKIAIQ